MYDFVLKLLFDLLIQVLLNNFCFFLCGLVGEGFVVGGMVLFGMLFGMIVDVIGEIGLKKVFVCIQVCGVVFIVNGFGYILKSIFFGVQFDVFCGGFLDKYGVGLCIFGVDGKVSEDEIVWFVWFGRICFDLNGGEELGFNVVEIDVFMQDNFKCVGSVVCWYYLLLMKFEWLILLKIIGKGIGEDCYFSVVDVCIFFNDC